MKIRENVPLAHHTTYRIGGPAKYFCEAENERDVKTALRWARKQNVPYFVLGGGSNVLVSDEGYNGLVLKIQNSCLPAGTAKLEIQNSTAVVGAGLDMQELVATTTSRGMAGLEWAGGLPGLLGGAIRGNAGAFGGEIKDIVKSVVALTPGGALKTFSKRQCKFGYRTSIFKEQPGLIILEATLSFEKGDADKLRKEVLEHIQWRTERHPMEYPNCGSVFKRKSLQEVSGAVRQRYPEMERAVRDGQVATAFFIDEAGLKNKRVGGAEISEKHPNFLVNKTGTARAQDVVMLANITKSRVLQQFGVILEEEIQYLE